MISAETQGTSFQREEEMEPVLSISNLNLPTNIGIIGKAASCPDLAPTKDQVISASMEM